MSFIGYINEKEALDAGFTHHGSYFGIPCWLADIDGEGMMVQPKFHFLEYVFDLFVEIEQFLRSTFMPGEDPGFQFTLGKEINNGPQTTK